MPVANDLSCAVEVKIQYLANGDFHYRAMACRHRDWSGITETEERAYDLARRRANELMRSFCDDCDRRDAAFSSYRSDPRFASGVQDLKVGDVVLRLPKRVLDEWLTVTEVSEEFIMCGGLKFVRSVGIQADCQDDVPESYIVVALPEWMGAEGGA